MKLQEAFEKYSDDIYLKRKKGFVSLSILDLKDMVAWANEDSRKLGFIIPQCLIEDAQADDWELSSSL